MPNYQTLNSKVDDIYNLFTGGVSNSVNFLKFMRITLTEQNSLRELSEEELRNNLYHYRSSKARCKDRTVKTVEEHVVPINVITEILIEEYKSKGETITKAYIKKVLERLLWCVFVTDEENKRLNDLGLKNNMPKGWNWKNDSPYARYELAKIKVEW